MLAKAGVPWRVIERLSRTELLAYCVSVGELEGRKFSWSRMEWEKPK
ncbi:MAG: hypothetical protein WCA85_25715 [Paraburkholderia sp.]